MLSRTADNLYWLARYVERADFLARIIKAAQRLATLPVSYSGTGTEWESALESSGAAQGFRATRGAAEEASVDRLSDLRARQSIIDLQLHQIRTGQCAGGAHRADRRDVGSDQRRLDRAWAI